MTLSPGPQSQAGWRGPFSWASTAIGGRQGWAPRFRVLLAWSLLLALTNAQNDQPRALQFEDVATLLRTGVAPKDVLRLCQERGLDFPLTPALCRHLASLGFPREMLDPLKPPDPDRLTLPDCGLSLQPAPGWRLADGAGPPILVPDRTAPSLEAQITFRIRNLGRERRVGPITLEEVMAAEANRLGHAGGSVASFRGPLAARGITGLQVHLVRDLPGERPRLTVIALFGRRETLIQVEAELHGPEEDPVTARQRREVALMLASIAPITGPDPAPLPVEDSRVRILALLAAPERPVVLLDREGRTVLEASQGALELVGDPLALRVGWTTAAGLHLLSADTQDHRPRPRPEDAQGFLLRPGTQEPVPWVSHARAGWPSGVLSLPCAGRPAFAVSGHDLAFARIGDPPGSLELVSRRSDASREPSTALARFRPAHQLDVVDDPGSDHWLVRVSGTYFPLPFPGATEPTTVTRLLYVPRDGGQLRLALLRQEPGEEVPGVHSPRFLPSGHEILFIDPARGLCVMPRDGGLPVLLRPDCLAAEPWLDLRP